PRPGPRPGERAASRRDRGGGTRGVGGRMTWWLSGRLYRGRRATDSRFPTGTAAHRRTTAQLPAASPATSAKPGASSSSQPSPAGGGSTDSGAGTTTPVTPAAPRTSRAPPAGTVKVPHSSVTRTLG